MSLNTPISRRNLLAGAAAAGAGLAASSLIPGATEAASRLSTRSADTVTLSFWINHDATDVPLFQKVVSNFQAKYPNIKINMTNQTSANFDTVLIPTRGVSGSLPDIWYNRTYDTADRANRGWTLALDSYMKAARLTTDDFWPNEEAQMVWKGHQYSLPYDWSDFGIAYNKDMFDKKGVKYPPQNGDWTWDELFKMSREFVDTTNGKQTDWGIDFSAILYFWPAAGFVLAWGGQWISSDLRSFNINTPGAAELFQTLSDQIFTYKTAPNSATLPAGFDPWGSGHEAMSMMGSWATLSERTYVGKRFRWDVAPMPKGPTGKRPESPAGGAWSIATTSKHPQEAFEFINFLTSTQSAEILISEPTRSIPGRKSAVPLWEHVANLGTLPPNHVEAFPNSLPGAYIIPSVPYYNELGTISGNYMSAMLVTKKAVKPTLAAWQQAAAAAIKKYQF